MTRRQKQLIETYVRKEVRRSLNEAMTEKASLVIMSHLSDVQEMSSNTQVRDKINFVKFLLMKYPNVSTAIDADEEYQKFKNR